MPNFGIDFSDPATQRTLAYYLAGMGRTIAGDQGVGGFLGGATQDLIRAQNFRDLIQSLQTQPTALTPTQPGVGAGVAPTPTSPPSATTTTTGTPATTGKAGTNKIMFEGTNLDDIARLLSGMTVGTTGNFGLPR